MHMEKKWYNTLLLCETKLKTVSKIRITRIKDVIMLSNHSWSSNSHFSLEQIPKPSDKHDMHPCLSDAKSYCRWAHHFICLIYSPLL